MTIFKGLEKAQIWTTNLFGLEGNIFRRIKPKEKKIIEDYGGNELKGFYYEFPNKAGDLVGVILIKFDEGWSVWQVDIETDYALML